MYSHFIAAVWWWW